MTELKTLKDLANFHSHSGGEDMCGSPICETDLRCEAIKRAKYWNEKWVEEYERDEGDPSYPLGRKREIMEFANLSEEDLK